MNGPARYRVAHHQDLPRDLAAIPRNVVERIVDAIESRLGADPARYGQRLRRSLRGFWKMRIGDYRVVYEIVGDEVRVHGVMHRRDVYPRIVSRVSRGWQPPEIP